jgi:hypothetical protein
MLMPNVSLGNGRLAWWLLLESARRASANLIPENEREIILISPWIRDVPIDNAVWAPSAISASLGVDSSEIELLSDVFIVLARKLNFRIQVCIRDEIGRTVPRSQSARVDQEYTMLRKLQDNGIQTLKIHRSHKKMFVTPIGAATGSMNWTYAGMRINRENNHFYFRTQDEEGYIQTKNNAQRELVGTMPYFDAEQINWPEFNNRYKEDIFFEEEAEKLSVGDENKLAQGESLTDIFSEEVALKSVIKDEDKSTPNNTPSSSGTLSPKALYLELMAVVEQGEHEIIPDRLMGEYYITFRRWEKKLREVVDSVYSHFARHSIDIKKYAQHHKILGEINEKWHYLVGVKIERTAQIPEPINLEFTEVGKKISVWKAAKSKAIDHNKKFKNKKIKADALTAHDTLKGTDLGQLLKASGFYHTPSEHPGHDGTLHDVREPWYEFLKHTMSISHGEAQRKFNELAMYAMKINEARNPDFHSNDIPVRYHTEGSEGMYKFYQLLFNPHDLWKSQ